METHKHDLRILFQQLGLQSAQADIDAFVDMNRLKMGQQLWDADFWSPQQAAFLAQSIADDADWAESVDELAKMLS